MRARSGIATMLGRHYTYPVTVRLMEIAGIAAYAVFATKLTIETSRGIEAIFERSPLLGLLTGAAFVVVGAIAMLAADFASGVVHCAADNFGSESTPFFGVAFIKPFRNHHRDPKDITRHDFVETNGNSCLVNLSVLIPAYYIVEGTTHGVLPLLLAVFVVMFTVMIVMTNQVHKWAHLDQAPALVTRMQRTGVILSPANHQVHHTPPFDRNYCITTGWMNALTERTGFFAWMVRSVRGRASKKAA
jgi:hypothetical protein